MDSSKTGEPMACSLSENGFDTKKEDNNVGFFFLKA